LSTVLSESENIKFGGVTMENITVDESVIVEARKEYYRKWRAANKDKVKQHNRRYWEKKAAELAASKQVGESNGDKKD
jgi:hypothetical protein